jgi:hypothetical protein
MSEKKCGKVPHDQRAGGYLHGEDDDGPYDVDGVLYCGRCHYALSVHPTTHDLRSSEQKENEAEWDKNRQN